MILNDRTHDAILRAMAELHRVSTSFAVVACNGIRCSLTVNAELFRLYMASSVTTKLIS